MRLKTALLAGIILAGGGLANGAANAVPCPVIGSVTTCNVVITASPGGVFSTTIANPAAYDGSDDTLVGIINNSGLPLLSIPLTGSGVGGGFFAFDGDGLQTFVAADGSDPTGYGGRVSTTANFNTAGVADSFSGIHTVSVLNDSGTVVFGGGGIPNGGSAYFSLEAPPSLIINPNPVPEPATLALLGTSLIGLALLGRRRRKAV